MDEPASRLHARLRRGRVARPTRVERRRPDYLLSRHPADRRARRRPRRNPACTSARTSAGYAVVGTKVAEQERDRTRPRPRRRSTTATAAWRCRASLRKAAFALRFGDWNLFVSGQLTTQSRIALPARHPASVCRPRRRSCSSTPIPYPVVLDGRILWVLDGYTTTNRYPYSQSIHPSDAAGRQRARHRLQLRAQLGEGDRRRVRRHDHFYVVDDDGSDHQDVPQGVPRPVRATSTRCPTGCASTGATRKTSSDAQTEQYTQYHMTDPQQFFQQGRPLGHRAEPRAPSDATAATTAPTAGGNDGGRNTTLPRRRTRSSRCT